MATPKDAIIFGEYDTTHNGKGFDIVAHEGKLCAQFKLASPIVTDFGDGATHVVHEAKLDEWELTCRIKDALKAPLGNPTPHTEIKALRQLQAQKKVPDLVS
jgi:hypothetical protein